MDKENTGEQPAKLYRNKETGELFTYREMLKEWRERYEGINPANGFYQYHWHMKLASERVRIRTQDGIAERE